MRLTPAKVVTAIYLLAVGLALYLHFVSQPSGEEAWLGGYVLVALFLLTSPWSLALLVLATVLLRDSTSPIFLIFFALSAAVNAYLIHRRAAS